MKQYIAFIICILSFTASVFAQTDTIVRWRTLDEAKQLFDKTPRPIMFYLYSNESDSCKIMDTTVFTDNGVADYINKTCYPIALNIYSTDTLTFFDGKKYANLGGKTRIHGLARTFMGDTLTVPSLVCFSREAIGTVFRGFHSVNKMYSVLIYYHEDIAKTTTYTDYYKVYEKTYPEKGSGYTMVRSLVKWKTLPEALSLNKTAPRKIFLDINVRWRNGCTIMTMQTYNNPVVADILNTKFYPVQLDAEYTDTLDVFGYKYINEKSPDHKYHQLPIALLNGKMKFPVVLIFNEESKLIKTESAFFTPENLEPFLTYYVQDLYKTKPYLDFLKTFEGQLYKPKQ